MGVENNIPEGWVKSTIGELTYFIGEKISPTELTVYNYISTENLLSEKKGVVVSSNLPNVSKVNEFRIGDILFSNIRTYFKKVWQANINGGASNDVLIFRPLDESQLNKSYLYRIISSDLFIDFTVKTAKGTKMPRGDKNAMKLFRVALPPLPEQKAIAKVLTAFDDKIELLQAQNKTLETMTQTIFKEWFGKYKIGDELPEGWRVGELNDLIDRIIDNRGKTPPLTLKTENVFPLIEVNSINGINRTVNQNLAKKFVDDLTYNNWFRKGHPVNRDVLFSTVGSIGQLSQVFNEKICIAQNVVAIRSKQSGDFLYALMKYYQNQIIKLDISSVQPSIKIPHLLSFPIVIPNSYSIKKFDDSSRALSEKIAINSKQIQSLTKTRDTLLPKLMSGQVRVKNLKQTADA